MPRAAKPVRCGSVARDHLDSSRPASYSTIPWLGRTALSWTMDANRNILISVIFRVVVCAGVLLGAIVIFAI